MTPDIQNQRQASLRTEERAGSDRDRVTQVRFAGARAEQLQAARRALDAPSPPCGISEVSGEKPTGEARPDVVRPTRRFRKFDASARLSRDQSRRQNDVLQSAWRHFGVTGPVIAFLNASNDQLDGGQPLHLAVQSDEGLMRVERLLGEMTYKA